MGAEKRKAAQPPETSPRTSSRRAKTSSAPSNPKPKPNRSKAHQAARARADRLVTAANSLPLPAFASAFIPAPRRTHTAPNDGARFRVALHSPATLAAAQVERLVSLIQDTSGTDYEASEAGWDAARKRDEIVLPEMRVLLVRGGGADAGEGALAGFLSFMLSTEGSEAVIYIYEIHLYEWARRRGVGGWLMDVAEGVGRGVGVEKSMLTVFASNRKAERFYRRRGYTEDGISPTEGVMRGGKVRRPEYFILSKTLKEDEGEGNVVENGDRGESGEDREEHTGTRDIEKEEEDEWSDVDSSADSYVGDGTLVDDRDEALAKRACEVNGIPQPES